MNEELQYDVEKIKARVKTAIDALTAQVDGMPGAMLGALATDLNLALFHVIVVDFINAIPTAVLPSAEIEQLPDGLARLNLPIPDMFAQYYAMRLQRMSEGTEVSPEDSLVTGLVRREH